MNHHVSRCLLFATLLLAGLPAVFAAEAKLMIAMMPKSKGNAYFISCKHGADRAAKELGFELLFDGPTDSNAAKQNEIVENWITLGVDVITVAAENKQGISTALRKAQKQGIKGVEKAYGDAMKQASRGAELARQSVREAGAAAGTQATQSMMSRGLYGTTVQDQAQRAVSGDTARNLGLINTALSEQQGQLGVSQALAKQGGLGQLSALYPALAGMKTETAFNFMKAFQKPPSQKPNIFGSIMGAVGSALGGPLGGALGSSLFGSKSGGASSAGELAPTLSTSSPYTYGPGQYKSTYWNQPLEF
jgi:hypothetical protein